MSKYLLSVDNGLTTTKAVIFTLEGKEVASSHVNTLIENNGDFAEIDMELQWANTAKVIKKCISKSEVDSREIVGVGNSGHGAGLYCLDESNRPVRKAISSMDARASSIIENWTKNGLNPYSRIYQSFWSGQAIPLLSWLKNNEPENYGNIRSILMVKDWIIYCLTGSVGIEYTDASNSGLINPVDKKVDKELFGMFEVEEVYEKIPKLRKTTDIAGYVTKRAEEETGLMVGTPVIGGVFDCIACALGSGVYDKDKYSIIAGTWNINSGIENALISPHDTVKCSLFIDINKYFYTESSATSAVNLSWFIDHVIGGFNISNTSDACIYKEIEERIKEIDPRSSDIIYMPFLYKSHLANMQGAFFGLRPEYNIFHMIRGIYEGVAFAHKMHIDNLKNSGITRKSAVLSGGASKSPLWSQMFADVLNIEVATADATEVGALGCAVCTSVALGIHKSIKEAIAVMVKEKKHFYPESINEDIYDMKYHLFKDIIRKFI